MVPWIESINRCAAVWTGLMGAVLWQSTLLIGIVGSIGWLLRRSSPGVRYWLWQIVVIKLLLMPFWTAAIPLPSWAGAVSLPDSPVAEPAEFAVEAPGKEGEVVPPRLESREPLAEDPMPPGEPAGWKLSEVTWQSWLLCGWLAIVLWQLVRLFCQRLRLDGLLRGSTPAGPEMTALVRQLAGEMGLRRVPAAALVDDDCPLFVCGLRRPVLVLPSSLAASLDPDRLRQALFHELAHVKRLDLFWGWTVEIARMIYFFHPLVYWVGCRLRLERELACDQLAMALSGGSPAEYTETLIEVISHTSRPEVLKSPQAVSASLDGEMPSPQEDKATDTKP